MNGILICIGGLLGVGKTTMAYCLSDVIANSVVICPDRLRLQILGKDPVTDVLTDEDITEETTRQVIELMKEQAGEYLSFGQVVIIGSAFVSERMRRDYEQMAHNLNAMFHGFWLEVDEQIRMQRVRDRLESLSKSGNASGVSEEKASSVVAEGEVLWHLIDAAPEVNLVVQNILSKLDL